MTEISKEYGAALFMLACESGLKHEFAAQLESIKAIFGENPQYEQLLTSPGVSMKDRMSAIDAVFADSLHEYVLSYLKLLCEKGRMNCFMESAEEYLALLDASEHIVSVKVTSAVELTDGEKQKLINKLELIEKCKVEAEYSVDAALLGGLIVEMDGKILDGSVRHRLYEVKEVINT